MPTKAPTMSSRKPAVPDNRPSAAKRGYGGRWRKVRKNWLSRRPLCVMCYEADKITVATVVDHIIPHKGNYSLMWSESNFQSLCKCHHDIKTATEDGGFGHKAKDKGKYHG